MKDDAWAFIFGMLCGVVLGGGAISVIMKRVYVDDHIRKCECCSTLELKDRNVYICPECKNKFDKMEKENGKEKE